MEPLFLGSHAALDFLNTRPTPRGVAVELIGDGRAFATWLEGAGLVDAATLSALRRRAGAPALDAAAAQARTLREWARDWIARWREAPADDYRIEVRRLNELLARAAIARELVSGTDELEIRERRRLTSPDDVIALLAEQVASLVANEPPACVRRCAGPECTLWFVDRTKAHRRLFCSPTACGNRAKVAAFRERKRAHAGRRRGI